MERFRDFFDDAFFYSYMAMLCLGIVILAIVLFAVLFGVSYVSLQTVPEVYQWSSQNLSSFQFNVSVLCLIGLAVIWFRNAVLITLKSGWPESSTHALTNSAQGGR
jgi:hypothetical protein|tara:strand:- start:41652 stop:41969 length:318 start_codon:yes stop_codon:yes gene_type:complete